MNEPQKHIVLSKFWVGDWIYHRVHGERGLITGIQFATDRMLVRYYCVFNENSDAWTDEMELTAEKVFTEESGAEAKA